jgi:hypothetical protein
MPIIQALSLDLGCKKSKSDPCIGIGFFMRLVRALELTHNNAFRAYQQRLDQHPQVPGRDSCFCFISARSAFIPGLSGSNHRIIQSEINMPVSLTDWH